MTVFSAEKLDEVIEVLKYIPTWVDFYWEPVNLVYSNQSSKEILWNLFRQGGTLCMVFNANPKNEKLGFHRLDLDSSDPFAGPEAEDNVQIFVDACMKAKLVDNEKLFSMQDIFTKDEVIFSKAMSLVQKLLLDADLSFEQKTDGRRPSISALLASKNETQAERVIAEIIETERIYVRDLRIIRDYKNVVSTDPENALSASTVEAIFGNLDELLTAQEDFLDDLEDELLKPPGKISIGTFFLESVSQEVNAFREYPRFCSNYPSALEHVEEVSEDLQKFDDIIPESQIHWYLIKPIQRICKYPLLLRELQKHTDPKAKEKIILQSALDEVKKVTADVNEEHRKGENIIIAKDLVRRLTGRDVAFTIEGLGPLVLVEPLTVEIQNLEQQIIVYLFQNYLLFCKEIARVTSEGESKKKVTEIQLKTSIETSNLVAASNSTKDKDYRLKCLWQDGLEVNQFFLKFKHQENLLRWLKALILLINQRKSQRNATEPKVIALKGRAAAASVSSGSVSAGGASAGNSAAAVAAVPATTIAAPIGNDSEDLEEFLAGDFGKYPKGRRSSDKAKKILIGRKASLRPKKKGPKNVFDWMDDVIEGSDEEEAEEQQEEPSVPTEFSTFSQYAFGQDVDTLPKERGRFLSKASNFMRSRKLPSGVTDDFPREGQGADQSKLEKMLMGRSITGSSAPKKGKKDIFSWMDEEMNNSDDSEKQIEGTEDSLLYKHFLTTDLINKEAINWEQPRRGTTQRRPSRPAARRPSSTSLQEIIHHKLGDAKFKHAKLRFDKHVWLIPLSDVELSRPYTGALKEIAAMRMIDNRGAWGDLRVFNSLEPEELQENLTLYYVDSEKSRISVNNDEDFWLCIADCNNNFSITFDVCT